MRPDGTVAPPVSYTGSETAPGVAGWYAVGICWDQREGIYPAADYWTGERWESGRPVQLWHGPHDSEHAARAYADRWDPEEHAADAAR